MGEAVNILMVEDNDVDVMMFHRAMKKSENTSKLTRARDGVEALEILSNLHSADPPLDPYVILLDINMPRMNGHDFMRKLRANKEIANSRVVVVTTSDDPKDIGLAYEQHASGYVIKPDSIAEMVNVINRLHQYWRICESPKTGPALAAI